MATSDQMFGIHGPGAFWSGGPAPGQLYKFPGTPSIAGNGTVQHTRSPVVTGTSVLGIKFKDGVVIAADMLGSYGSLARFRNCSRLLKVNDTTIVGAAGDFADFQYLSGIIEQQTIDDECLDDGFGYTPVSMHCWLARVLYNRRSQFNPLWNTYIVAGLEEGTPYLGYVDKIGIAYQSPSLACGFGAHIALPIIRKEMEVTPELSKDQAITLISRCMKLLYYRDARSLNKYQYAVVTKDGVDVQGPIVSDVDWEVSKVVKGYE